MFDNITFGPILTVEDNSMLNNHYEMIMNNGGIPWGIIKEKDFDKIEDVHFINQVRQECPNTQSLLYTIFYKKKFLA